MTAPQAGGGSLSRAASKAPFAAVQRVPTAAELAAWQELQRRCEQGLADEREAVVAQLRRWGGDQPLPVTGATFEGVEGDTWIYTLRTAGQVTPPDYTSVEVLSGDTVLGRGVIEAVDPSTGELTVALEDRVQGTMWDSVMLRFDSTALIEATKNRLSEITPGQGVSLWAAGFDTSVGAAPVPSAATQALLDAHACNTGQGTAITRALAQPFHLTFGPPGTGKTNTLAVLAKAAVAQGERVLLVAHTNAALDTAVRRLLDLWPDAESSGQLVRLGKPSKQLAGRDLGLDGAVRRRRQQEEVAEQTAIQDAQAALAAVAGQWPPQSEAARLWMSSQRGPMERRLGLLLALTDELHRQGGPWADVAAPLREVLREVQQRREMAKAMVLSETPVVALTLSKLMLVSRQDVGSVDRLILDEASMAMLPQVLVASACAPRFSGFGDPRQLPPVVQGTTAAAQSTVGCDLFSHLGLGVGGPQQDGRLTLLPTQYRMRPAIRQLVSKAFYDNQLEDAPSVLTRDTAAAATVGPALWLVDTSDTGAVSERGGDSSRLNNEHGAIVAALVAELEQAGERDLGVITPFAAQSRRLRSELQARRAAVLRTGGVKTIHKAQGGEMDTVILDLVDAGPLRNASRFLDDRDTPALARLLCVALSRARERLIIVAHTGIFREQSERRGGRKGLVLRLLGEAYRAGQYQRLTPQWRQQGRLLVPTPPTVGGVAPRDDAVGAAPDGPEPQGPGGARLESGSGSAPAAPGRRR